MKNFPMNSEVLANAEKLKELTGGDSYWAINGMTAQSWKRYQKLK